MSDQWLDDLANALGQDALNEDEVETLLDLTRDVAHGVERKFGPLSMFLLGLAVGSRSGDRDAALTALIPVLTDRLP